MLSARSADDRGPTRTPAWLPLASQPQEAAEPYRDLLRDPDAAETEHHGDNHHTYRERTARQLFDCCRHLLDLGGLMRECDELLTNSGGPGRQGHGRRGHPLGTATTSLFGEIYRELAADEPPVVAVGHN